ncbi:HD domain-containing phosphohydrolase [Rhizobium sp. PAMB 3174]
MRVVIVDDSASVVSFLQNAIAKIEGTTISTFTKPLDALNELRQNEADLLLVDYTMPRMNGVELIRKVRRHAMTPDIPIIMLTSETDAGIKLAAMEAGATEFVNKPIDTAELTIRVRNLMNLWCAQRSLGERATQLERDIAAARQQIARQEEELIWRLSKAMACRDGETAEHVARVAAVASLIGEELGLDAKLVRTIYLACPLHDVGKIGIPDAILLKPGSLSAEEFDKMRQHSALGAEILSESSSPVVQMAARIADSHHEKWDGSGYPKGLRQDEIPIEGRVVAVADVFDALCSERPYKKPWPVDKAFQEIVRSSGSHFDPACVAAFCRQWQKISQLYKEPDQSSADDARSSAHPHPLSKTGKVA